MVPDPRSLGVHRHQRARQGRGGSCPHAALRGTAQSAPLQAGGCSCRNISLCGSVRVQTQSAQGCNAHVHALEGGAHVQHARLRGHAEPGRCCQRRCPFVRRPRGGA
eukprot:3124159-Alexandrium_andersonii.AAC.1